MASSSSSQHRCVFVGNIPYDATEEQLIEICREVGPVVSFRLVIDRETGKPKGYGFCEYKDEETALSARRNLQGYEINGRQLRVDFAENDKNADKNREQGRGGPGLVASADPQKQVGGSAILSEPSQHQPIGLHMAMTAATVMAGALGGAQTGVQSNQSILQNQSAAASDPLTFHLAKMSRSQLNQIMAELKVMATQNKEAARQLLLTQPQLSKALFQAQIMLGMVTPQVLQMPNIRQTPGQFAMHLSQDAMHPPIQTIPALPPVAQKTPLGLMPQIRLAQPSALPPNSFMRNQVAASAQPPIRIQSLIPQNPSNMLQQATLGSYSGVVPLPPVQNPSVRLVTQTTSAFLNQQAQPPFLQPVRPATTANFARSHQMLRPSISMQSSQTVHPVVADTAFQPGPLISPGNLDAVIKNADSSASVPIDPIRAQKRNVPLNAHPVMGHDSSEIVNRPSKLAKLDDEKGASNGRLSVTAGSSQPFAVGSSTNRLAKLEEPQYPDKQGSQLPPDMESTLLQQVLNLTPEQLSSLPPDQRQQVIQLQQALRQDQMQQPS